MKWSIFDPKNASTLNDVRDKYDVSPEKLTELKQALEKTKLKLKQAQASSMQGQGTLSALRTAVQKIRYLSRKEVLNAFNQRDLRDMVKGVIQDGGVVAYVQRGNPKVGATKAYKIEAAKFGRIRLSSVIVQNPLDAVSSGIYSARVDKPSTKKTISKSGEVGGRIGRIERIEDRKTRKTRKTRIYVESKIKE